FTERGHLARRQPRSTSFARFVAWRVALRRATLHAVIGVRDGHHVTAATERSASTRIGNVSSTRSGLNEMESIPASTRNLANSGSLHGASPQIPTVAP